MAALWVLLFIIGVPIIVVFWIAVALITAVVWDNKKSKKQMLRLDSTQFFSKTSRGRKRNVKPTIMRLPCKSPRRTKK